VSIKNDGHYFCRAGGNRPDGLNEPVTHLPYMATQKPEPDSVFCVSGCSFYPFNIPSDWHL
ncbi:hypothetical protein, partial [Escherichia coli]|uniref:hypothetical protein n=1 Tax=Escherichia coli TaxID=562 RepID=UPI001A7E13F0